MAGNMDEFNRIVGVVADDISVNMDGAAVDMAESMSLNAVCVQTSFDYIIDKAHETADAVAGAGKGERRGTKGKNGSGGSKSKGARKSQTNSGSFNTTTVDYDPRTLDLDDFQSQLELDIKGYTDAISNIDAQIEVLKNLQASFGSDINGGIGGHGYADKIKDLEKEKSKINDALKDAKDSTGSAKTEFAETVDFFKQRIKVLNDVLALLKTSMDNVSGSFAKNNLVDAELGITEEKFNNYTDALSMYTQKANEALSKLPADIAAKVKDGAVALTDFIGDGNKNVVEAIKEYESWAGEIADCQQTLAELKKEIRQLELEKFNNIMDDFSSQFDLRGNSKDLISKQVDLLKEAGELIGESFFTAQIEQSKKQLDLLETEKAQLVNQMSSAVNSGRVQYGTEEWLEMVNTLNDLDGNILDCKKSIEEFDNELLNIHTEVFNRIQEQFSNINSEISNIIDLFDDMDVSDDKGIWTKEGITQLGLLAQQYELAQYQVKQYSNEIDELNSQYLAGRYSATEYADKLAELNEKQWDAVKSSESAKDAVLELNEARVENAIKGIEKEVDAYKELIDAQIAAIDKEKELHDYKQSIADKTKNITDIERQIAAMQYDTSASGTAKRKQLEEQLAEAKKTLEEEQYQHSVEIQQEALNKQYENYEKSRNDEIESLKASLNDKETIIVGSFETVKENASLIGQEIASIAVEHGIIISDALISSWQSGEMAVAGYGEVLSQNTSAFITNIMGVENEMWNLQANANNTANSLAWMFSTKADSLVNELALSYYSEANLANMTNALQQSLVNTLERGYDVSGITNALASIESAAVSAKKAMDDLRNTPTIPSGRGDSGSGSSSGTKPTKDPAIKSPNTSGDYGSSNSSSSSNTAGKTKQYVILNAQTGAVIDRIIQDHAPTTAEIQALCRKHKVPAVKIQTYAKGTRNSEGGIIITDEEGYEMKLPKLSEGRYTIADEGTQILTKEQTDNLFKWADMKPDDMITFDMADPNMLQKLWRHAGVPEPVIERKIDNTQSLKIGNLINVQGNIDNSNVKQMEAIANNAVNNLVNKIYSGVKYGK